MEPENKKSILSSIYFQLASTIMLAIFLIEIILLLTSVNHKQKSFKALNQYITKQVESKYDINILLNK